MALEDLTGSAKYISDLTETNPTATDNKSEGDDHIRGVKNVLKNTFPNVSGAATATHTELNYNDITTLGTVEASKTVTADANGDTNFPSGTDLQVQGVSVKGSGSGSAIATTSGTTADFTGIPATATVIDIILEKVSLNAIDSLSVLIGDSGGFETSGYDSGVRNITTATANSSVSAFQITQASPVGDSVSGIISLRLLDSSTNTWVSHGILDGAGDNQHSSAGSKSLTATLDRVRLTSVSASTFDNGKVNILYR